MFLAIFLQHIYHFLIFITAFIHIGNVFRFTMRRTETKFLFSHGTKYKRVNTKNNETMHVSFTTFHKKTKSGNMQC